MTRSLARQINRNLFAVAALAALVGSALVAVSSSWIVLQVASQQAIAQGRLFEKEVIRGLRTNASLKDLRSYLLLRAGNLGIEEALLVDRSGLVLAAGIPAQVGRNALDLARDDSLGPLAARLGQCLGETPVPDCRSSESSRFVHALSRSGGVRLLRTRRTRLGWQATSNPGQEVVLFTSIDLTPLRTRSLLLAAELFVAGMVPLLLTGAGVLLAVRRAVLPELFHLAQTDSLSGVYNRRAFSETAQNVLASAEIFRIHYVLAIIDIDRFKDINDSYGHAVGDAVIRHLSDLLLGAVRRSDVVGRLGGDEFVLLLKATRSDGHHLLDRTRLVVAAAPYLLGDGCAVDLTISIGMASTGGPGGHRLRTLMERADAGLYAAKQRGRNQVVDLEQEGGKGACDASVEGAVDA